MKHLLESALIAVGAGTCIAYTLKILAWVIGALAQGC